MTTLKPREPYSPAELEALYPKELNLQLVQVLLRHGERTPVTPRFMNAGVPPFWPYCRVVRQLRSAVLDDSSPTGVFSELAWKRRLETFGQDDAPIVATGPKGELDDVCDMGSLTDLGRHTTLKLGQRLRHLYVDQLGFLPENIKDTDFLYLRATPIPRALHSLQQTFQGLYPPNSRADNFPPPTILSRTPGDETLFPNDSNCRRFAALSRAFAKRTAERWNPSEELDYVTKKIGKWMPDEQKVAVDAHPRLSGVMDTINATDAHGPETKLPKEFYDARVRSIIDQIGVEEWYSGYKESEEYRRLGIGGLLGDVVARMVGSAEKTPADGKYELMASVNNASTAPIRFGLSGCHDTTLAGVLSSLGAFENEKWPPFTSHVAIELFKKADHVDEPTVAPQTSWLSKIWGGVGKAGVPPAGIGRKRMADLSEAEKNKLKGHFVRIRYNDKPVTIPGCKLPGNHLDGDETFCTLEAFKSIVDKFTPQDWKQECQLNKDGPIFPSKPEPAGY